MRTVPCAKCGGGGFSGYGTGYDAVCDDCGGLGETPEHFWSEADEAEWHRLQAIKNTHSDVGVNDPNV